MITELIQWTRPDAEHCSKVYLYDACISLIHMGKRYLFVSKLTAVLGAGNVKYLLTLTVLFGLIANQPND